jgi:hypothetical protein
MTPLMETFHKGLGGPNGLGPIRYSLEKEETLPSVSTPKGSDIHRPLSLMTQARRAFRLWSVPSGEDSRGPIHPYQGCRIGVEEPLQSSYCLGRLYIHPGDHQ